MKDFAAIDFETANECPSSVCSVGVVIVRDGQIVDSFYSLIHPEPDYYSWFCLLFIICSSLFICKLVFSQKYSLRQTEKYAFITRCFFKIRF